MTASSTPARRRLGVGAAIVVALSALGIAVGIGAFRTLSAPADTAALPVASAEASPATATMLYVHMDGAVRTPGLYRLPEGARVMDAVAAAGGLADDADSAAINLARLLVDGEQVRVPVVGETPAPPAGGTAPAPDGTVPGGKVNVNTADAATLDTLPGVGPAIAERIIAWRTENGPFRAVEDLLAVPGIGEKVLESLRDAVTL